MATFDRPPFTIVVGASAGGLEPLHSLLAGLPSNLGAAVVVAMHGVPERTLSSLLSSSAFEPRDASDGEPLRAGVALLLPGQRSGRIEDGRIRLTPVAQSGRPSPSLDVLFESAAHQLESRCLGVILSGSGADGTLGARAIKAAGGLVVAQTPETAQFDAMPASAISSGLVDAALDPEALGPEVARFVRARHHLFASEPSGELLPELIEACHAHTGFNLGLYKAEMLRRRLEARLAVVGADSLKAYAEYARANPLELEALARVVLISVTRFFRDPKAFAALRDHLREELTARRGASPFRVWVPACATGEEAYTIAILIAELIDQPIDQSSVVVFGTDIDNSAIERARLGVFGAASLQHVDSRRMARWFQPTPHGYVLDPAIRRLVVFAHQDVMRDPPFSQIDLVACRNLLIYLQPDAQADVLSSLHYSLRPNGLLFMGRADSVGAMEHLFLPLNGAERVYRRREGRTAAMTRTPRRLHWTLPSSASANPRVTPRDMLGRAMATHAGGGSILVNGRGHIEYIQGDISRYFVIGEGEPDLTATELVIDALRPAIRSGLYRARRDRVVIEKRNVPVGAVAGGSTTVDVRFLPVADEGSDGPHVVVHVRESPAAELEAAQEVDSGTDSALEHRVRELEAELAGSQENLQDVIEQLETANEELHSLNQDLTSANEQLQSANEELETSNEELQATNEEIHTVNEELRVKTADLDRAHTELSHTFDAIPMPLVVLDADLRIRRLSPSATRGLDLHASTIGSRLEDVAKTTLLRACAELAERVREAGAPSVVELDEQHDSYQILARPLVYDSGPHGVLLLVQDLTDARERERYFSALVESAPDIIIRFDRSGRHLFVNRTLEDFTGRPREEWLGRTNAELGYDRNFYQPLDDAIARVFATGEPQTVTSELSRPDGDQTFEIRMVPERLATGEVCSVMAISRDMTRLASARSALLAEQEHSRLLLDSMSDSFFSIDRDLVVTYFNQGSERLLGRSSTDVVGRPLFEAFPEARGSIFEERYVRALAKGRKDQFETWFEPHKEWYDVRVYPTPKGLGVFFDIITDVKKRQQEATEREKATQHAEKLRALGTLAGGVAHEFNNVLMSVLGFAELLQIEAELGEEPASHVQEIVAAAQRGQAVTHQILSFSRKATKERHAISLNTAATNAARTASKTLPERLTLRLDLAPDVPLVLAHAGQIEQVLINLIGNARDAFGASGTITLRTSVEVTGQGEAAQQVRLSVIDDGCGMPPELAARVFDPFFTTKSPGKGTGLGLSIAYGIIRSFGGTLTCESEVGRGTRFDIVFSAASPANRALQPGDSAVAEAPAASGAGERVLVVEDERSIQQLYARLLRRAGFEPIAAETGEEALEKLKNEEADFRAVVLDANMPGMGGLQALRRMLETRPALYVVVVSGFLDPEEVDAFRSSGARRILFKPVTGAQLLQVVRRALEERPGT